GKGDVEWHLELACLEIRHHGQRAGKVMLMRHRRISQTGSLRPSSSTRSTARHRRIACVALKVVRSGSPSRTHSVHPSEADGLAVCTLFRSSEVTLVELENELPPPELGAQTVAPNRPMAAGF